MQKRPDLNARPFRGGTHRAIFKTVRADYRKEEGHSLNKAIRSVGKRKSVGQLLRRDRVLLAMLFPGFVWYFIFCYITLFGLLIAFQDYTPVRGIMGSPWVGLKWFKDFFQGRYFFRLTRNTVLLNLYSLLFGFPIPIAFAILLNEIRDGMFKRSMQTVSYLPHFISTVVICGMMTNMLSAGGVLYKAINILFGISATPLSQARYFRTAYVASEIWQSFGWNSIIYLAAMATINHELYEAAYIDGAGRWKRIFHVTLPGLRDTVIIMLILNIGNFMSSSFEKVNLLYSPATYETADVISTYVYRVALKGSKYSFGTAVGLFNNLANLLFLLLANTIARKYGGNSLW